MTAARSLRRRVWEILEVARRGDRTSERFDLGIRTLNALPTAILGSAFVDEMRDKDTAPGGEARCPTCDAPVAEPLDVEP